MIKKLEEVLGFGHFSTVYRGYDEVLGRVAVKILKKTDASTDDDLEDLRQNLIREAQNLAKASHVHVVRFYNVDPAADGALRLVMEYCDGGSIADLHRAGPLRLARVREIATGVAMGLDAIHARGMLHRDIKPANILLDKNGIAKLGDFGLVTDKIVYGYASAGDKKYAPHLAKEVWDGQGTSPKTDVWALGMTIYRLIHGEDWYDAYTPHFSKIKNGGYARKLCWLPHVPNAWRKFIRKCLHDNPSLRYQNASQVLSGLAVLPVEPDWECTYSDTEVCWRAHERERLIEVRWYRPVEGPQRWEAISLPLGSGKRRRLDSGQELSSLDKFFEARAR